MTVLRLEPFALLLLLLFLMGVLLALSLWFLLTLGTRRRARPTPRPESWEPSRERSSNDVWRGAKRPDKKPDGDPFEKFIRGKNDELDF